MKMTRDEQKAALIRLKAAFNTFDESRFPGEKSPPGYDPALDFNSDGVIDGTDYSMLLNAEITPEKVSAGLMILVLILIAYGLMKH